MNIKEILWCGSDALALHVEDGIILISKTGAFLKFEYTEPLVLSSESDGLRIISNSHCEFLQRVPGTCQSAYPSSLINSLESIEHVYKIGSTHPAAILVDTYDHYTSNSVYVYDTLIEVQQNIEQAIETSLSAVREMMDIPTQKKLLDAIVFANGLSGRDGIEYAKTVKWVRVLNCLRRDKVGMFLTGSQYVSSLLSSS